MQPTQPNNDGTVDALNELLRGELSAVESYDRALPAMKDKPALRSDLQECRASHEVRVEKIRRVIIDIGGQPVRASGAWGLFAKATATGARALGWKAVISALEEGEDHGVKEYDDALSRVDQDVRPMVAGELYPEQQHTHSVMSAIRRGVHA